MRISTCLCLRYPCASLRRSGSSAMTAPTDQEGPSPYIHISTCHSGNKPAPYALAQQQQQQQQENLRPATRPAPPSSLPESTNRFELSSYEMGDDSVFLQDTPPKTPRTPGFPAGVVDSLTSKMGQTSINNNLNVPLPPGRPPKPPHLANNNNNVKSQAPSHQPQNYANSNEMQALYQREMSNNNHLEVGADQIDGGQGQGHVPAPQVARSLKPGRERLAEKSATMNPKMMGHGRGHQNGRGGGVTNQGFATMAHPESSRAGNSSAPPVPRSLKPRSTGEKRFENTT